MLRFKTVIFGRQKSEDLDSDEKFADSDANSESVTTLYTQTKSNEKVYKSHLLTHTNTSIKNITTSVLGAQLESCIQH